MQYTTSEDMIHANQAFTQEVMAWQSQPTQVLTGIDVFFPGLYSQVFFLFPSNFILYFLLTSY